MMMMTMMMRSTTRCTTTATTSSSTTTLARRATQLLVQAGRRPTVSGAASSSLFSTLPSAAGPWLDSNGYFQNFTDNTFQSVTGASTGTTEPAYTVRNPATQDVIGIVPETSETDLDDMIEKARVAYGEWKYVPVSQRQRVMLRLQHLIREHTDALAATITAENGKTLGDAAGDVFRGLEVVETACAATATHLQGQSLRGLAATVDTTSYRRPLGVTAGICPFNFPAMIPLWMFPLAVTTGNVMLLKPSEKTPATACQLAALAAQAGLPPNVLQIVHGGRRTVAQLCRDDSATHNAHIRAVSFVGSNAAGEWIADTAHQAGKRVQANLGAKNHAVVLPDAADPTAVVKALVGAAYGAGGQRCMALSTLILVGDAKVLLDDIVQQASQLKVGPGWMPGVEVGPLITPESKTRVESIVTQAEQQGAQILLDGRGLQVADYPHGNFVGPTVVQVPDTQNVAYTEEIFGPVLTVLTADSLEQAMQIINDNPYGNGCALFTSSGAAARKFTMDIECGQVGINIPIPVPLPMFSFTGNKKSIRGDLNFYGAAGVHFYTQLQTVSTNWPYNTSADLGGVTMPTMGKS